MTAQEKLIYKLLTDQPADSVHMTPDGSAFYMLVDGGMMRVTSILDVKTFTHNEILQSVTNPN